MWSLIKEFFAVLVAFLVIDILWIAFIANKLYLQWIGHLSNLKDGRFDVKPVPAVLVYVALTVALQVFVLRRVENLTEAAALGALLGLCCYSVYDLTNLAVLKDYPLAMAATDMVWGTALCGAVSALAFAARDWF